MFSSRKAQASLEYLMIYGFALVIIAGVIGILVFVADAPIPEVTFSSSDPTIFPVKGVSIDSSSKLSAVLKNLTGGRISIKSISFFGGLDGSSSGLLNAESLSSFPITVGTGDEMRFENINLSDNCSTGGAMEIDYTDADGLNRSVKISCSAN